MLALLVFCARLGRLWPQEPGPGVGQHRQAELLFRQARNLPVLRGAFRGHLSCICGSLRGQGPMVRLFGLSLGRISGLHLALVVFAYGSLRGQWQSVHSYSMP